MAEVTNAAKAVAGNGLGPRTRIVNLAKNNMSQAELDAALTYLTVGDGSDNLTDGPHTIAGISVLTEAGVFTAGTTDAVQVAIQGTGVSTMGANFGIGSTGVTASLIADFEQNP